MTKQEFEALVARGPVLLDGAMGSNLLERGMPKGALSELWADRHPETVLELQAAYAAAGSRILYAPTFQAQPEALAQAGWTGDVGALNARLVPNRNAAAQYRQHSARLTALEHRWQWVSALSATAGGTLSSKQKIRLEAYIQMNYLDRILVHANTRSSSSCFRKYLS